MAREICTSLIGRRTQEEIRQRQQRSRIRLYAIPSIDEDLKHFERRYEGQDPRYERKADAQEHIHSMHLMLLYAIGFAEQDTMHKKRFYLEKNWI
jgi:hypothetical protein